MMLMNTHNLELQIIDIFEHDNDCGVYEICLFCVDHPTSKSVCVRIQQYHPYFYVQLEEEDFNYDQFCELLEKQLKPLRFYCRAVDKKILNQFSLEPCKFVQLSFDSLKHYMTAKHSLITKTAFCIGDIGVSPMLKFCHLLNIQTSGWISVSNYETIVSAEQFSRCWKEISISSNHIQPLQLPGRIAKFKIASFDIETTTTSLDSFPLFTNENDTIIQIGTTVEEFGDNTIRKYIATLGECEDISDAIVERCNNETELIIQWTKFIRKLDPDFLIGYNIFGYDFEYIFERALYLGIVEYICNLSRISAPLSSKQINRLKCKYKQKFTQDVYNSTQPGDPYLLSKIYNGGPQCVNKYIKTTGRVNIDLLKYCRENGDHLSSYKLDAVAKHYQLPQGKNDMPYKKIFEVYRQKFGKAAEKRKIAEYCIQDCYLCNQLMNKLNIMGNSIGMSSTCFVPINFLFIRGQGVKIESLLSKECHFMNFVIPYRRNKDAQYYKGATVLTAQNGFYDCPISVLDFASLYPSCMISSNLCSSTILQPGQIEKFQLQPHQYTTVEWWEDFGAEQFIEIIQNLSKARLHQLTQKYTWIHKTLYPMGFTQSICKTVHAMQQIYIILISKLGKDAEFFSDFGIQMNHLKKQMVDGEMTIKLQKIHHFMKPGENNQYIGVIPKVLLKLLQQRNATKKLMSQHQSDPFLVKIYNCLQLAYKITANSVYGQLGANFGAFGNVDVAASCTATGRKLLQFAQNTTLNAFFNSRAVYGDTDSVFIQFELKNHTQDCPNFDLQLAAIYEKNLQSKPYDELGMGGSAIYVQCHCELLDTMSKAAIMESIRLANIADQYVTSLLPYSKAYKINAEMSVHQLEYEKTYQPFILFTKKKYVGKMYTKTDQFVKIDSKGIVLSRRDNCKLLKIIYEECLHHLLNNDVTASLNALDSKLRQLIFTPYNNDISAFIISKTLGQNYKNNCNQPHVLLAQRVRERDPGNAFHVGERIPYCFIDSAKMKKKTLQLIETPEYILENNLKLDYGYYIEKQLRNPISQLFSIVNAHRQVDAIFNKYLREYRNKHNNQSTLDKFIKKKA